VEEEIALLPWDLEADETEGCSQSEGLLAFAADDRGPEFHKSPRRFTRSSLSARSQRFHSIEVAPGA
jgi:hypothetical protein